MTVIQPTLSTADLYTNMKTIIDMLNGVKPVSNIDDGIEEAKLTSIRALIYHNNDNIKAIKNKYNDDIELNNSLIKSNEIVKNLDNDNDITSLIIKQDKIKIINNSAIEREKNITQYNLFKNECIKIISAKYKQIKEELVKKAKDEEERKKAEKEARKAKEDAEEAAKKAKEVEEREKLRIAEQEERVYQEFKNECIKILTDKAAEDAARKAAEKAVYQDFKNGCINILNTASAKIEEAKKEDEEAKRAKVIKDLQNKSSNQEYEIFKLNATSIINKHYSELEKKHLEEEHKNLTENLTKSVKSAEEQKDKFEYEDFKRKALAIIQAIHIRANQDASDYAAFKSNVTAIINAKHLESLAASATKAAEESKDASLYEEFKSKAQIALIQSQSSIGAAEKEAQINNINYDLFKLKAEQALQSYARNLEIESGYYTLFKQRAESILNDAASQMAAEQRDYNEFKLKALNIFSQMQYDNLNDAILYEEFKRKAIDVISYVNPDLGSTEWISTV